MLIDYQNDRKLSISSEIELQHAVVNFLRTTDLQFTSLSGSLDTDKQRVESYKSGYTSGTPDILILTPCSLFSSFALELKRPAYGDGCLSKNQQNFLEKLENESNAFCMVSNNYTDIIVMLVKYINNLLD